MDVPCHVQCCLALKVLAVRRHEGRERMAMTSSRADVVCSKGTALLSGTTRLCNPLVRQRRVACLLQPPCHHPKRLFPNRSPPTRDALLHPPRAPLRPTLFERDDDRSMSSIALMCIRVIEVAFSNAKPLEPLTIAPVREERSGTPKPTGYSRTLGRVSSSGCLGSFVH